MLHLNVTTEHQRLWACNGYSEAELKGTLYRHINQVIEEIEHLSGGDVVKQMELAERVFKSLKGPSKAAMEDRADRVQNSILAGLKMWYVAMSKKHRGRFSNVDRAALQAVETAIAAALSEGDFSEAQRITGFNRQKLQVASDRYACFVPLLFAVWLLLITPIDPSLVQVQIVVGWRHRNVI